ncbi:MAG: polyhydroxyalkanoate synthesis repressor PhaR [Alphaproteobacteria bacterium]
MADKEDQKSAPITIKKYANRRLYNTATSSYVTLDHLCQMVKDGLDFVVYDAKTGEDITRSVLTQIIVEEESKGQNLLPISFLRQLIGFYGDNMQSVVPRYLEYSMQAFSRNQEQMRDYFQNTLGGMFPFGRLDEVSKQNMAMFERAMRMFTPFGVAGAPDDVAGQRPAGQPGATAPSAPVAAGATFDELQKQIDELQKQIASIAKPAGKTDAK